MTKKVARGWLCLGFVVQKKLIAIIWVYCILYHANTTHKRIVRGWGGMEFIVQKFNINNLSFLHCASINI